MKKAFFYIVGLCCLGLMATSASLAESFNTVLLKDDEQFYDLTLSTKYFHDAGNHYSLEDIRRNYDKLPWQALTNASGSSGVLKSQVWFAVKVETHPRNIEEERWLIRLNSPNMDQVSFSWFSAAGLEGSLASGFGDAHNDLALNNRDYVFPLSLRAGESYLLLMRVSDLNTVYIAPTIATERRFMQLEQYKLLFYGFIGGFILLMVLYNLSLGNAVRDKTFFAYVGLILSYMVVIYTTEGIFNQLLWGESNFATYAVELARSLVTVAVPLFTISFLRLHERRCTGYYILLACIVLSMVNMAAVALQLSQITTRLDPVLGMVCYFTSLTAGYLAFRRGVEGAGLFTLAWLLPSVAIPVNRFALMTGVFAIRIDQATLAIEIFVIIEMVLLSWALSGRIKAVQAERMLAEARSHTKTQFLAKVGHELRTPLNGIIGLSELLRDHVKSREGRDYLKSMRQSGDYLSDLINDLLDISKIEENKIELECIAFNIRQLTDSVVDTFVTSNSSYMGVLEGHVSDEVPHYLMGDPTRIRQIITNFTSNALKFTREGSVELNISMTPSGMIRIAVKDSGVGIAEDRIDKIFRMFEQESSSTTRQYGGTGLGLTISKMLAELMGGEIGVHSVLGEGSEFWVDLPLETAETGSPAKSVSPQARLYKEIAPLTIMVAEDNQINQLVVKGMLEKLGHRVDLQENGQLALAAYTNDNNRYDMILMDCDMPVMDGFQATENIRRYEQESNCDQITIVALTADALKGNVERCKAIGMNAFLSKPVTMENLAACIERYRPAVEEA